MKAIRINAPGEVAIVDVPKPERKPGDGSPAMSSPRKWWSATRTTASASSRV